MKGGLKRGDKLTRCWEKMRERAKKKRAGSEWEKERKRYFEDRGGRIEKVEEMREGRDNDGLEK